MRQGLLSESRTGQVTEYVHATMAEASGPPHEIYWSPILKMEGLRDVLPCPRSTRAGGQFT